MKTLRTSWFWRLVRQALLHRARSRTLLVAVALAAAVLAAMLSVYLQLDSRLQREMRAYGANLLVSAGTTGQRLDQLRLATVLDLLPADRRIGVAPYLNGVVSLARGNHALSGRAARTLLVGTDLAGYQKVKPHLFLEGDWPLRDHEILVGMEVAAVLNLAVGETVAVQAGDAAHRTFTVSGLIGGGDAEDDQVLVSLPVARSLLGHSGVDGALVSLVGGAGELAAAAQILTQAYPELAVVSKAQVTRSEEKVRGSLTTLFFQVAGVMGLTTLLCLVTTMITSVSERQAEIGLKKALGARTPAVTREFLAEAAVLGLGGGLLGLGLGWGLARIIGRITFGAELTLPWPAIPFTLVGTVLVTILAALGPVRRLAGLRPAMALRGDHRE